MHNHKRVYVFIATILCNYTSTYSADASSTKKLYATATAAGAVGGAVVSAIQAWRKPRTTGFASIGQYIVGKSSNTQTLDDALTSIRTNHDALALQASALGQHIHGSELRVPLKAPGQLGILDRLTRLEKESSEKATRRYVEEHLAPIQTVMEALLTYMKNTKTPTAQAFNKTIQEATDAASHKNADD